MADVTWGPPFPVWVDRYKEANLLGLHTDCLAPHILAVNKEAYEVVTQRFSRIFETLGSRPGTGIWFDGEQDWLYLRLETFSRYFKEGGNGIMDGMKGPFGVPIEDRMKVRKVALSFELDGVSDGEGEQAVVEALKCFPRLKHLRLTHHYIGEGDDQSEIWFGRLFPVDGFMTNYKEKVKKESWDNVTTDMFGYIPLAEDIEEVSKSRSSLLVALNRVWEMEKRGNLELEKIDHSITITRGLKRDFDEAVTFYNRLAEREKKDLLFQNVDTFF